MTKTTVLGIAAALLMSGAALAQTNPAPTGEIPPPAIDQTAPTAESPLMPAHPQQEDAMSDGMEGSMMDPDGMTDDSAMNHLPGDRAHREWRARHHGPHGMRHARRHWHDHHGGYGRHGDEGEDGRGAVLSFSQGGDGPSFRIRCADGDTTLECTSAIAPILDRLIPRQPGAAQ